MAIVFVFKGDELVAAGRANSQEEAKTKLLKILRVEVYQDVAEAKERYPEVREAANEQTWGALD